MRLEAAELDLGPADGARVVFRTLLLETEEALAQLESGKSREALHDFRVALRRLRSLARALRPWLGEWVRRKHERRLRDFAVATTETRDAEVQIGWLTEARERASAREAQAVDWLRARLEKQERAGYQYATGKLAGSFRRFAQRRERALERRAGAAARDTGPTFGESLAEIIRSQASELLAALEAVHGPFDVEHAHASRIAAKRLRYLLEPLRGNDRADAAPAVHILKELQDLLGELHDAHVLGSAIAATLVEVSAERARRAHAAVLAGGLGGQVLRLASRDALTRGLLLLDQRVAERATTAASNVTREWLPGRRAALEQAVATVVQALSPRAPGRAGSVRRFLLLRLPEELTERAPLECDVGWLPGPAPRAWLLRIAGPDGARCFMGRGSRLAQEEISAGQFATLWPQTGSCRLVRRRRLVVRGGQTWTIDEIGDGRLVVAEIAAPPGRQLRVPRWLRAVLVREVTGEKDYQDERLASRATRSRAAAGTEPSPAEVEVPPASDGSGASPAAGST